MCLGAPGQIIELAGATALVDFWGVRRQVAIELADEPLAPGDYVLVHVGFVIRRIAEEDLEETLAFFAELARGEEAPGAARPAGPDPARPAGPDPAVGVGVAKEAGP